MLILMGKDIVTYDDYEGLKNKEVAELLQQFDDEIKEKCKRRGWI